MGALPRGPRQNSRLGLPLLLMPEEARLLAEIGAVTLVSAPRPDPVNTAWHWHPSSASKSRASRNKALWQLRPERPVVRSY